jgi:superfamily II DNA or RNA helicase
MILRSYQVDCVESVFRNWQEFKRVLVVQPTGCGKTICFAHIAKRKADEGKRVLILANREELLQQASDKIRAAVNLETALEKAESTAINSLLPITVGSVQTLSRSSRLKQFPADYFDTIIVDEGHHALASSWQSILQYFYGANVALFTATPDRSDRKNLGQYVEALAHEYTIRQAIADGYLCKIAAQTIPLKIDLSKVRTTAGDYNDADLGTALDPYLEQIADHMADTVRDRRCLVFLPLIKTSEKMTELLRARGFPAAHVCGVSPDRAAIISAFQAGDISCLCNSMLLTEGFDCPPINCIVCLRPTKIRSLYAQVVGRGTRIHPDKQNLLILDFLWHTTKHDLCHPCSLVAETAEVADRMTALQEAAGGPVDLEDIEQQAKTDTLHAREEALARELRQKHGRKGKLIDPVEFSLLISDESLADYEPVFPWESKEVSTAQKQTLSRFGFDTDRIPNRGYASKLMNKIFDRRKQNMASPGQIKLLKRFGYPDAAAMPFATAKATIDAIAKNGWRPIRREDAMEGRPLKQEKPEFMVF